CHMKQFIRFEHQGEIAYGQVTPEGVYRIEGTPFVAHGPAERVGELEELNLCAPVVPGKILGASLNYRDHARETGREIPGEPIIFMKPPSSVIGPGAAIVLPPDAGQVDYEAELAVIIGESIFRPDPVAARRAVFGYTCANDVTDRDLQRRDGQWVRAKGFDTFCPLGPVLNYDVDLGPRRIETRVNGEIRQESTMEQHAFSPDYLVWFCAQVMTLHPGDVILTGTPGGIGPMRPGDEVEVQIEGFGALRNPVISRTGEDA
ncbi:MAG: fumarylacetoacetate hydrolase family protein, partial [Bacillota bacterium]